MSAYHVVACMECGRRGMVLVARHAHPPTLANLGLKAPHHPIKHVFRKEDHNMQRSEHAGGGSKYS